MDRIFTYSPKQKATAGYCAEVVALAKSETRRIFALGTPSEPGARKAWNRWHMLTTTSGLPCLIGVANAAERGDTAALETAFSEGGKEDAGAAKLIKGLGMKVCELLVWWSPQARRERGCTPHRAWNHSSRSGGVRTLGPARLGARGTRPARVCTLAR
jgi:hypothetical protein